MSIEAVLASNLDALMSMHPEFNSQLKLSKKTGVGQTTVGRIRRAEGAATIDNVELLAKAFHLRACDLLDARLQEKIKKMGVRSAREMAFALAAEIQEANLNERQLAILANTLAAMRSQ